MLCGSISFSSPVCESIIFFTNLNFILLPPFAIVDTIEIICIGVTSNLWPNEIVANSTGPTLDLSKNIPFASPGKSIPVLFRKPNFSK